MGWWATFLAGVSMQLTGATSVVGALITAAIAIGLWAFSWHRRQLRNRKAGVQNWHWLLTGIAGSWIFLSILFGAAGYWVFQNPNGSPVSIFGKDNDEGPLAWFTNLTMEGGPLSQANVFALQFRGMNNSQKEVHLKDANIISAISGAKVNLEVVVGSEFVAIDKIELIPPGAPIVLIAKFGPPADTPGKVQGIDPKTFIETWRQFSFNAEDDTRKYRVPFNEAYLQPFFPGMVGPHVTKK